MHCHLTPSPTPSDHTLHYSKTPRSTARMASSSLSFLLSTLLLLVAALSSLPVVQSYPLIAQVSEGAERCFKFNIPEDDDAHMVFMALPLGEETNDVAEGTLEGWLVQELYEMTTKRQTDASLPSALLNAAPQDIQAKMDTFIKNKGSNDSKVKVVVSQDDNNPTSRVLPVKYFAPTVINHVRATQKKQAKAANEDDEDNSALSGYRVCFDNKANEEDQIQVILDVVMVNTEPETSADEPNFVKEKHLSPLEESLEKSIKAANTVLREMKYMTEREERMRVTADSINQRVQYFSVLSVVILLGVTYVQVTYLKRYFKKKKLM